MEQKPPGTGPLSPDFSGIDPGLMSTFITSLTSGRDVIKEEMEAIRRLLTSVNVSSLGLQPVGQILDWLETELPQLRRRNQAIQASDNIRSWAPGLLSGLVPLDEKTMLSQAEARRQGKALAERFASTQAIDWGWPGGKATTTCSPKWRPSWAHTGMTRISPLPSSPRSGAKGRLGFPPSSGQA
jgi:hypothetical protein